jgi:hypothetical protein
MPVVIDKDKSNRELNDVVSRKVGDKLRQVYSDIASEPVPDHFIDLINQLEKQRNKPHEDGDKQDQDKTP